MNAVSASLSDLFGLMYLGWKPLKGRLSASVGWGHGGSKSQQRTQPNVTFY